MGGQASLERQKMHSGRMRTAIKMGEYSASIGGHDQRDEFLQQLPDHSSRIGRSRQTYWHCCHFFFFSFEDPVSVISVANFNCGSRAWWQLSFT